MTVLAEGGDESRAKECTIDTLPVWPDQRVRSERYKPSIPKV